MWGQEYRAAVADFDRKKAEAEVELAIVLKKCMCVCVLLVVKNIRSYVLRNGHSDDDE